MKKPPVILGARVVGVRFRSPSEVLHAACVTAGDGLLLEREPTNPYDPGAIKAMADTAHVGYIERSWAGVIAYWMDKGIFYTARVQMNCKRYMVVDLRPILPPERKKKKKIERPVDNMDTLDLAHDVVFFKRTVFQEDMQ
jgi:hypothetical protein